MKADLDDTLQLPPWLDTLFQELILACKVHDQMPDPSRHIGWLKSDRAHWPAASSQEGSDDHYEVKILEDGTVVIDRRLFQNSRGLTRVEVSPAKYDRSMYLLEQMGHLNHMDRRLLWRMIKGMPWWRIAKRRDHVQDRLETALARLSILVVKSS